MDDDDGIGSPASVPLQQRQGFEFNETQNGQILASAEVELAPAEIGRRVRVRAAQILVLPQHQTRSTVTTSIQMDEGLDRVTIRVIDDPVQRCLDAQALSHDGAAVEFDRKFLHQVRTAETKHSFDTAGLENGANSLIGHAGLLEPERLEPVTQFLGASDHALINPGEVYRVLPRSRRVIE